MWRDAFLCPSLAFAHSGIPHGPPQAKRRVRAFLPWSQTMWRVALLGVLGLAASARAGDLPSGPAVGDKLQEFKVLGFSGSEAGKEFGVLRQAKNGPTLLVFVHQISR